MSSEHAVLIEDMTKTFRTFRTPIHRIANVLSSGRRASPTEFTALKDMNLRVDKGECLGILGPNGSGKSTLLRIISGTMAPTAGTARIRGQVAGILELGAGFLPDLTGRENAVLNAMVNGVSREEAQERMDWISSFSEIGEFIDRPIRTYSSGMFVRLAFAVAAAATPEILVIDEALAVGDIAFQQKCHAHMRIAMEGSTRLFVSHDVSRVSTLCDRCIVLHHGEIVYDGHPDKAIVEYLKLSHEQSSYVPSENVELSGPREIDISGIKVTVEDEAVTDVFPGDDVQVEVFFDNKLGAETCAVFGTFWSDETGQAILSSNSQDQGETVQLPTGASSLRYGFRWPDIRKGRYRLTVGIGDVPFPGGPQRIQCWAHKASELVCLNPQEIHGVISTPMTRKQIA
ncbi:ATP-binding cassette domain-containing protein [Agrobacterium rubi]|nr:ATP-binding cassette domain-containing protein [Agrobacterium rubi]NTF24671.1 ATP-binding cassette domain-containing protein [Agrobacterium rubi]